MENNNKVAVIAGLEGCFDALIQFRRELETKKISKVISLGNSVGLHYHADSFLKQISDFILLSSFCEKRLTGEHPILELGAVGRYRIIKENFNKLSDTAKSFLRNLNFKYSIDDKVFFGCDYQIEKNKVNFYF